MRHVLAATVTALLVTGCGSSTVVADSPVTSPYDGPMDLPLEYRDRAGVLERSGAAGRALECDGDPYAGGGADYDSGLASVQDSAEAALKNLFEEDFIGELPETGYRIERVDGGRVLFSYDVRDRTRIAFVAYDGIRDFNDDEGWGIEAWAECDPSELPARVTDDLGLGVWEDLSGRRVPVTDVQSFRGSEHCDWQDVTFLWLGSGRQKREFLRETDGELADFLHMAYDAAATLPSDATDTGLRRDGRQLWLAADRRAAYLVSLGNPDDVERWPASKEPIRCA